MPIRIPQPPATARMIRAIAAKLPLPRPLANLLERRPLLAPLLLLVPVNLYLSAFASASAVGRWIALVLFALCVLPLFYEGFRFVLWSAERVRTSAPFRKALLVNCVSWTVLALAYPPLPLGYLAPLALVPWLLTLRRMEPGEARAVSFWSGWLFNAVMYYWIYNVAKVGPPVAVLGGLALLIAYLALFHVLAAWLFQRLDARNKLWLFPLAWVGIEVLRTRGEMSFPWGHLGYTAGVDLRLMQPMAWIGAFGISLLWVVANLLVMRGWELRGASKAGAASLDGADAAGSSAPSRAWRWIAGGLAVPVVVWLAGFVSLALEQPPKDFLRVALVQPSIPQHIKWQKANFPEWMQRTFALVDGLPKDSVDLVVLPETAVPRFARSPFRSGENAYIREYREFQARAAERQVDILVGMLDVDTLRSGPRKLNFYNSAFLFRGDAGQPRRFVKTRLVPFSEKLPWDDVFPMLNYVDFGEGDFTPGTEKPLWGGSAAWTPNICYETVYPQEVREMSALGARLIVNITNDGWFGHTTAPGSHLNLVRVRAVEHGMPVARAANTGYSAFIDGRGRVSQVTALDEITTRIQKVGLRDGETLYARFGGWLEGLMLAGFLAIFAWALVSADGRVEKATGKSE